MHRILLIASFTALALVPASGRAQGSGDETGRRLQATRAELEARRDALREMARRRRAVSSPDPCARPLAGTRASAVSEAMSKVRCMAITPR